MATIQQIRSITQSLADLTVDLPSIMPISMDILKDVRAILIHHARSSTGEGKEGLMTAVEDMEYTGEASEESRKFTQLFHSILTTSLLPALSNQHRTIAVDVLSTWMARAISTSDANVAGRPALLSPFLVSREHTQYLLKQLTSLLITYFEDASSALSKALKDLLGTILANYTTLLSLSPQVGELMEQEFGCWLLEISISSLARSLKINGSDDNHGELKVIYYLLETLVKAKPGKGGVRAESILYLYDTAPHMKREVKEGNSLIRCLLLNASKDRGAAPAIGRATIGILSARKSELLQGDSKEKGMAAWMNLWMRPLIEILTGLHSEGDGINIAAGRRNLVTYVLPGLFRTAGTEGFNTFMSCFGMPLSPSREAPRSLKIGDQDETSVDAWLSCLRVGKEIGFVDDVDDSLEAGAITGKFSLSSLLVPALINYPASSIQVSTLTLLTFSSVTTKPLPRISLELLKSFLPSFHSSSDPEFRNHICGLVRGLIERLAGSSFVCAREARKLRGKLEKTHLKLEAKITLEQTINKLNSEVENTRGFVEWYVAFLELQMYPGKGFPRISMAMKILKSWIMSGVGISRNKISIIKQPAINQKKRNPRTGPQRSEMQFPFTVELFTKSMVRVLLDNLFNPFEDLRAGASDILKTGLLSRDEAASTSLINSDFLARCFSIMRNSGRARDADGLAHVLEILYHIVRKNQKYGMETLSVKIFPHGDTEVKLSTSIEVLHWLVKDVLEAKFLARVKAGGVQEGANGWPIHGILSGLRLIFERDDLCNDITEDNSHLWSSMYGRLIQICHDIWIMNQCVLCDAAPEGYLPSDFIHGIKEYVDSDDEDEDEDIEGHVAAQTLMSYSWRAIKESSALLGVILCKAPCRFECENGRQSKAMLSRADFERGGRIFLDELANIRHRGAFSAVSPSFFQLCKRCFESSDEGLHSLPRKWLMDNLSLIASKASLITRRSAGIPLLIVGILTAESDVKRPLLAETFRRFKDIAELPTSVAASDVREQNNGGGRLNLPQVHALNCIKLMFTDSRLVPWVTDLIGEGLELAVSCFGDPIWAIRNCGIMLFSTLINRLFATRKSRNDYAYTASTYSTRKFFQKYPAVRNVLLCHLESGVKGLLNRAQGGENATVLVEMVYPALSLIARLDVAPEYNMKDFEPLILQCMASPIWKIREAAAGAYVTLVVPANFLNELKYLLEGNITNQNKIHGNLCAVKALLMKWLQRVLKEQELAERDNTCLLTFSLLKAGFEQLFLKNQCPIIRSTYLEILELVAFDLLDSSAAAKPLRSFLSAVVTVRTFPSRLLAGPQLVGNYALRKTMARIFGRLIASGSQCHLTANEVICLLENHDDGVVVAMTEVFKNLEMDLPTQDSEFITLEEVFLKRALMEDEWSQLRIAIMELLDRLPTASGKLADSQLAKRADQLLVLIQRTRIINLRDAALRVLGKVIGRVWQARHVTLGPKEAYTAQFLRVVATTSHENVPYTSRKSALESLSRLSPILGISPTSESPVSLHACFVPAYFALYDFLNDDDESIRTMASRITCQGVLNTDSPMIPLATSEVLMKTLSKRLWHCRNFTEILVDRLIGPDTPKSVLKKAETEKSVLFVKERQNLFVDDVKEADVMRDNLIECASRGQPSPRATQQLLSFVLDGAKALNEHAAKTMTGNGVGADGPMGWTSFSEEVFILGVKVFNGFGVIAAWRRAFGEDIGVQDWETVLHAIGDFDSRAAERQIHEAWLRRIKHARQILTSDGWMCTKVI